MKEMSTSYLHKPLSFFQILRQSQKHTWGLDRVIFIITVQQYESVFVDISIWLHTLKNTSAPHSCNNIC